MVYEVVASQTNGFWGSQRIDNHVERVRNRDGGACGICGCLFILYILGIVFTVMGGDYLVGSTKHTRQNNINLFNSDLSAWGSVDSPGSLAHNFSMVGPLKAVKSGSKSTLSKVLTTKGSANFGEPAGTIASYTDVSFVGTVPVSSSSLSLQIVNKYSSVLATVTQPTRRTVTLGSCTNNPNGCPTGWSLHSGKCVQPNSCYCQCTSGPHNGLQYQTGSAWGFDCLSISRQYCGTPSTASEICNTEYPQPQCSSLCSQKGGTYYSGVCTQYLSALCVQVSQSSSSTPSGCFWEGNGFTQAQFGAQSSSTAQVSVFNSEDPTLLGALITSGCNLGSNPSHCFGLTQGQMFVRGLAFLVVGLVIVCCPCVALCLCAKGCQAMMCPSRQSNQQGYNQVPNNQGGMNQYPTAQPAQQYVPIAQPAQQYVPTAQPAQQYVPTAQPAQQYVPTAQPAQQPLYQYEQQPAYAPEGF